MAKMSGDKQKNLVVFLKKGISLRSTATNLDMVEKKFTKDVKFEKDMQFNLLKVSESELYITFSRDTKERTST